MREMRLDEPLAQEERLRADLREALVAAARRRLQAQLVAVGAHHLAVAVADRQELVQRVDDRRVRQRAADRAEHVVADEEGVLEVDDVGLVREQEVAADARVERLVARGRLKSQSKSTVSV